MSKINKNFFEFKNITETSADLYIYGEIVFEKSTNWWTGKESETEVGLNDFKDQLESLGNIKILNLYINSPGGDVFVASTMASLLTRLKDSGVTVKAYVDGISASAASFFMMAADEINLYKNSIVMIHKPMTFAWGNSNDMQKVIDSLEKIEDGVMIPLYMNHAKSSEEKIKELIVAESWLSASEVDEHFDVILLDEKKVAVAKIDSNLYAKYKNVPSFIKEITNSNSVVPEKLESPKIDASSDDSEEKQIKAKLGLIKNSLIIKNLKEKGEE